MQKMMFAILEALMAVGLVTVMASLMAPVGGLTSAALLYLLPVLWASVRGGIGPGLVAALGGAAAYNFFFLEPRFTFAIYRLDNLISVLVLAVVAVVTSRLATRLMQREDEARQRACASEALARFSALLAHGPLEDAVRKGEEFLARHYKGLRLVAASQVQARTDLFSSMDRAAALWSLHNGDLTGHGTGVLSGADWSFVPLAPRHLGLGPIVAVPRPTDGGMRTGMELSHLSQMCLLLGQCRDRADLEDERHERAALERAENVRRTFLTAMAHDFRTPLTVLTGRLEILAQQGGGAREAFVAARQLSRMINNLLDEARLHAGALAPVMESLDVVDVVQAACEGLMVPSGLSFERHIPADVSFVRGDAVLLQHMLMNLMENAARHARAQVRISAVDMEDGVWIRVEDDGPGVPSEARDRVFERFTRLAGQDDAHGSGLGLAIVKGFADAMGMRVDVRDSLLGGACFGIRIARI